MFRRFNGLLLGRPLRRRHIAALGIHRRKGFHFRQGIGSRWDFHRRRRGIESAWQPWERALPRVMRERGRGSGLPMATKTADQVFGEFPSARRPARLHPPEARTMATIPARTASGSRYQTATTSARSGGTALDFALVLCSTPPVFPEEYPVRLNPVRANEIARRSGQAPPERMSSLRWTTASRTGRWVCLLRTAITLMRHAPWLRPPARTAGDKWSHAWMTDLSSGFSGRPWAAGCGGTAIGITPLVQHLVQPPRSLVVSALLSTLRTRAPQQNPWVKKGLESGPATSVKRAPLG